MDNHALGQRGDAIKRNCGGLAAMAVWYGVLWATLVAAALGSLAYAQHASKLKPYSRSNAAGAPQSSALPICHPQMCLAPWAKARWAKEHQCVFPGGGGSNDNSHCKVTEDEVLSVLINASSADVKNIVDQLNGHLRTFDLNTPDRVTQFFAQIAAETGEGRSYDENLNYAAYSLHYNYGARFNKRQACEEGRVRKGSNSTYDPKSVGMCKKYYKNHPKNGTFSYHAADQEAVANRLYAKKNGNCDVASGDGYKYHGRGLLQTTGLGNYIQFQNWYNTTYKTILANENRKGKNGLSGSKGGKKIKVGKGDLTRTCKNDEHHIHGKDTDRQFVTDPKKLLKPKYGILAAVMYWTTDTYKPKHLYDIADEAENVRKNNKTLKGDALWEKIAEKVTDPISKGVNGGSNGKTQRREEAKQIMKDGTFDSVDCTGNGKTGSKSDKAP